MTPVEKQSESRSDGQRPGLLARCDALSLRSGGQAATESEPTNEQPRNPDQEKRSRGGLGDEEEVVERDADSGGAAAIDREFDGYLCPQARVGFDDQNDRRDPGLRPCRVGWVAG